VGADAKYGLTQNLTADLTYNTDFAQVEEDSAQLNLTRFSAFFPERREFFIPHARNGESTLYGSEFEIRLRNQMTQRAIARECG
jgi:hypothetical protein